MRHLKPTSLKHAEAVWSHHTPKRLKSLPVESISRADWLAIPDKLLADGKTSMSFTAHAFYRSMLNQLSRYARITSNPLAGVSARAKPEPRDRVLTEHEEQVIWRAADSLDATPRLIIQTLMVARCRANEIIDLRNDEVDLDAGVLTISAERIKTN